MEFNRVKVFDDLSKYKDEKIIEMGTKLLVESNIATTELNKEILDSINQYGPYFVFENESVSVAHTKPGDYCKKTGISLMVSKKGVNFYGKKGIKIFVTLCVSKDGDHMVLLKNVISLLSDNEKKQELINFSKSNEK